MATYEITYLILRQSKTNTVKVLVGADSIEAANLYALLQCRVMQSVSFHKLEFTVAEGIQS